MTTCRWHSWGLSRETPAVEPGLGPEGEDQVQHHSGLGQTPLVRPRPSSRSMSPPARSLTATLGPPVSELRRQLSRGRGDLHTSPVFSVEQPLMTGTSSASLLHSSGLMPSLTQRRCSLMFVERSGLRATRTEFASGGDKEEGHGIPRVSASRNPASRVPVFTGSLRETPLGHSTGTCAGGCHAT